MSRFIRSLVVVATLFAVLSASGVASANHINNPVLRRQHPGIGFWQRTTTHHVQIQSRPRLGLFR